MYRRRMPWMYTAPTALLTSQRDLKTLDVREYRPLGTPMEFRFYQRYANHPNRQSGIQFLTHYNTHQRFRVNKDFIDYMQWGREQGQARLPHRHQRVAFDFDDSLHPTLGGEQKGEWFRQQDPTMPQHPDLSNTFDPNKKVFSQPEHWNKMFSRRLPGEGDIKLDVLESPSLMGPLLTQTDTQNEAYFGVETRGPLHGKVPGVNAPFLGEFDRKMMQAMSRPLNKERTITSNDGRFSNALFLNDPKNHQTLTATLAKQLNTCLDRATNGVYSKLTVLEAAQSGQTDYFCGGMPLPALGLDMQMASSCKDRAASLKTSAERKDQTEAALLLDDAARYEDRADRTLREHAALVWRAYTAPRPLMTLVNGKCRGTGCGLALAAKYSALRDSTEFIFDGPNMGLTPYGGLTRLLARPETSLKFPGLAEFVMLTGTSLFAGDALRLGWSDLFTTLPDMNYHIKEWFNNSEHMHNDAVSWQLGHLLETCFKMKDAHTSAMERCAATPTRARWIEDAFADQPSVEAILATLGEMEKLPYADAHNSQDPCTATPFTLATVKEGLQKLEASHLRFNLSPWDVSPPEDEVAVCQAAEIFTSYVLERQGNINLAVSQRREQLRRWQEQREREYHAYCDLQTAPHPRHVYVRLEGCEGTVVEFDHIFDPHDAADVSDPQAKLTASVEKLKQRAVEALDMPEGRDVEIGWYMPTLDTCAVHTDEELMAVLHADPGIEDPSAKLAHPPIYFIVKRNSLYFSEWAYAVKHQLLMQSPYALKATYELLKEVRADGSEEAVKPLSEALSTEFKYVSRALRRPDFYLVGQHLDRSADEWEQIKEDRARNVHQTHLPQRPLPDFEEVFERNVTLDGHTFPLRPRWSPRTLEEVTPEAALQMRAPLSFEKEGIVPLDTATYCAKADRVEGMVDDVGGFEIVAGLGEVDAQGALKVPPLQDKAYVPTDINFYEMARHPWEGTASSWRRDGFTKGSMEYFEQQYKEAEAALYDEQGRGGYNYWPSKAAVEGTTGEESGTAQLEERLYGELRRAEKGVEGWARTLRRKAVDGKLEYRMEIATQQEKIYDDEYYRWFIEPGQNPNPSGLLMGRKSGSNRSAEDVELDAFLNNLVNAAVEESAEATPMEDLSEPVEAEIGEDVNVDNNEKE